MKMISFSKPTIGREEIAELSKAALSGWLASGERVLFFEKMISDYCGVRYVKALNSCTSALNLAVLACSIGKNDEVITTPLTFCATINAIIHSKAKPVLCDIDPNTLNIDPLKIEGKINKRTKAIVIMHYGGLPCDLTKVISIARKYKLRVITDAAHAIGAEYKNKKIGSQSDVTCFSFHAAKNMTTAEGGAIVTNNKEIYQFVGKYYYHGFDREAWLRHKKSSWEYNIGTIGFKYNMSDLSAALGICQLKKLDSFIEKRKAIADIYNDCFKSIEIIRLQKERYPVKNVYHLYPIVINIKKMRITRARFIEELKKKNIIASVHYIPIYRHTAYKKIFTETDIKDLKETENIYQGLITLPIYPLLSLNQAKYVAKSVETIVEKYKKKI